MSPLTKASPPSPFQDVSVRMRITGNCLLACDSTYQNKQPGGLYSTVCLPMAQNEPEVKDVSSSSKVVTPHSLVTEDHVRAALTADKGTAARLTAWKVVDFTKKGDNYASVVSSAEVKYVLDGQSSEVVYVVKLNSCRGGGSTEALNDIIFEKESKFYVTILPVLNSVLKEIGQREIHFPKCLHANLEKGKEVIFLEDLRSQGFKMFDRKRGMDEAHATLVLKELARLHAASLLLQSKNPGEDLQEKYPCLKMKWYDMFENSEALLKHFVDGIAFSQEILKKVGGYDRAIAWVDTLISNLVNIFHEQEEYGEPKVVCHGDCWNNNLLFRYNDAGHPEDVMLLDLQVVRYGAPAIDLNYLFYSSMTGEVRKANLQAFLDCYLGVLTNIMEIAGKRAPFTQEQFLKDFRDKSLYGALFGIIMSPVLVTDCADATSSKDTDEELDEILMKTRAIALETLDTNPAVKSRLLSVFDEMEEMGLIP